MIPTLIGITFITYSLVRFSAVKYYSTPGETFSEQSAAAINSQAYKNQIKLFGLDKPAYEGYFLWVKKFASLDFGISLRDFYLSSSAGKKRFIARAIGFIR